MHHNFCFSRIEPPTLSATGQITLLWDLSFFAIWNDTLFSSFLRKSAKSDICEPDLLLKVAALATNCMSHWQQKVSQLLALNKPKWQNIRLIDKFLHFFWMVKFIDPKWITNRHVIYQKIALCFFFHSHPNNFLWSFIFVKLFLVYYGRSTSD